MEKIIKTDEIKSHYIELLRAFLSQTGDIPDKDLTGLPAPHIPVIGTGYESAKVKMAFYGIETKWWARSMVEFKNKFLTNPETGYAYLTELFTPQNIIKWSKGTFFKYIIGFLGKFYGKSIKEIKSNEQLLKIPFVWGNINSLEEWKVTAKANGVKQDVYNKVKNSSKIFDCSSADTKGPTYILRECKPDIMLILNWDFQFRDWLKAELKLEATQIKNPRRKQRGIFFCRGNFLYMWGLLP
jgi:hypothetical protein